MSGIAWRAKNVNDERGRKRTRVLQAVEISYHLAPGILV